MKLSGTIIISMLLVIALYSLGCVKKQKTSEDDFQGDETEQSDDFTSDFDGILSGNKLTEDIINETPDNELVNVVFDNLSANLPYDSEKEYKAVLSWNASRRTVYLIRILESEVSNGGFNQFYFNQGKQFKDLLPNALERVGAAKFSELVKKANDVYEQEKEQITKHQDGSLAGFVKSYEDNPLNEFDDKFTGLYSDENLQELQVNFIRNNRLDFID